MLEQHTPLPPITTIPQSWEQKVLGLLTEIRDLMKAKEPMTVDMEQPLTMSQFVSKEDLEVAREAQRAKKDDKKPVSRRRS